MDCKFNPSFHIHPLHSRWWSKPVDPKGFLKPLIPFRRSIANERIHCAYPGMEQVPGKANPSLTPSFPKESVAENFEGHILHLTTLELFSPAVLSFLNSELEWGIIYLHLSMLIFAPLKINLVPLVLFWIYLFLVVFIWIFFAGFADLQFIEILFFLELDLLFLR